MQLILKDFTANFSKYVFITDNLRTNTWRGKNHVLSYKSSLAANLVGNKLEV